MEAPRRVSYKSVTWSIRYDETMPPQVVHHDQEGKKWVLAMFLYEDRRRFHLRMTYDEFVLGLRAQNRFRLWEHVHQDQIQIWVTTNTH